MTFLAVPPKIADWCAVDMVDPNSEDLRERLAVAHVDPQKVAMAKELFRKYPPDPETDSFRK